MYTPRAGDRIRILTGPWATDCGIIEEIKKSGVLLVKVDSKARGLAMIQPDDVQLAEQFPQPTTPTTMDFDRGFGIGGLGRHIEPPSVPEYTPHEARPGSQVCPAGTTYGTAGRPDDTCSRCGSPADWNSGAGELLCPRHWDDY